MLGHLKTQQLGNSDFFITPWALGLGPSVAQEWTLDLRCRWMRIDHDGPCSCEDEGESFGEYFFVENEITCGKKWKQRGSSNLFRPSNDR